MELVSHRRGTLEDLRIPTSRYRSLRRRDTTNTKIKVIYISVAALWIYNVIFGLPYAFFFKKLKLGRDGISVCSFDIEMLIDEKKKRLIDVYTYGSKALNYFIPFVILIVCYVGIIYEMKQSTRRVAGRNAVSTVKSRQSRNVVLMCILVVVIFTVRSMPYQIVLLALVNNPTMDNLSIFMDLWSVYLVLCILNPVIYGVLWKEFRKHTLSLFCPCCLKYSALSDNTVMKTEARSSQMKVISTAAKKDGGPSTVFTTEESMAQPTS